MRAVRLPLPLLRLTEAAFHTLPASAPELVVLVSTQVVPPSALICRVSSEAKVRAFCKVSVTLPVLALVTRSLLDGPVSLPRATVCVPVGAAVMLLSTVRLGPVALKRLLAAS